ncbi:MAG: hypothetical protein KME31_19300 [Tolypothrix carrinoi HA7290-LM1]|nr:hypothetical protein [Tolypothrix carrinoi HA7290-LM1]
MVSTPGASSRQSRRQVLQRGENTQRTASPTHWLPMSDWRGAEGEGLPLITF